MKILSVALSTFAIINFAHVKPAFSEETIVEKSKELGRDIQRGAKQAARKVKDETCELTNGKMECAAQKVKHSIQNTADKIEDAVE